MVEPLPAAPPRRRNDGQIHADPLLQVEQSGQLADRHAVPRGDGVHANERRVSGVQQGAFHDVTADRIRPIENDERDALARRGLHRQRHGRHVRPGASADLLKVIDQDVHVLQHRGSRAVPLRRIEGVDRQAGLRVDTVIDSDTRLGGAADTVFRRQQGHQCQVVALGDQIDVRRA